MFNKINCFNIFNTSNEAISLRVAQLFYLKYLFRSECYIINSNIA